jgi:hypothetical protein
VPAQPAPCALEGGLTLFHPDNSADAASCWRPPFDLVKSTAVAFVVTWSAGSSGAASGKDYAGLLRLAKFKTDPTVAMVAYGKGSPCDAMPSPLRAWERALCIAGHNVGAREAHSILHFATAFYDHLPQAAFFLQDDAHVESLRGLMHDGGMGGWAHALMADALARQRVGGPPNGPPQPDALATHWGPPSCGWVAGLRALSSLELSRANGAPPCDWGGKVVGGENFTEVQYGGYRPMAWLLRTFFADFANATLLPSTIVWPGGAQFAVARPAVRSRPLAFWSTLLALASPRAPLKHEVARQPNATDKAHTKSAKWANFGPVIVDLGPIKEGLPRPADNRPGMNGMDFAQVNPAPTPHPYPTPYPSPLTPTLTPTLPLFPTPTLTLRRCASGSGSASSTPPSSRRCRPSPSATRPRPSRSAPCAATRASAPRTLRCAAPTPAAARSPTAPASAHRRPTGGTRGARTSACPSGAGASVFE